MAGSRSREGWILKNNQKKPLKRRFAYVIGELSNQRIADATGADVNIVNRLFRGELIAKGTDIYKLFNYLLPTEEKVKDVNEVIDRYCDLKIADDEATDDQSSSALTCIVTYAKLLHLNDMQTGIPVYRKHIPRLDNVDNPYHVDVFDESVVIRTQYFKDQPLPFTMEAQRNSGTIDLQPVYPPREAPFCLDLRYKGPSNTVQHFEREPEQLWQGVVSAINGFQQKNEYFRSFAIADCVRVILAVDMTSLPVYQQGNLFTAYPKCDHIRKGIANNEQRLRMNIETSLSGIFIMDTSMPGPDGEDGWKPNEHTVLQKDNFEMRFFINWNAVREASKTRMS